MTPKKQDELTFMGLQKYLSRVGFTQAAPIKESLAFEHPASGTLIILSIPADNRSVRPADLLSVLMRLEYMRREWRCCRLDSTSPILSATPLASFSCASRGFKRR